MPSHFLKPGDFRFDMGLRRGSLDYFRNTGAASLLDERCLQLQVNPDNYAAALPGSEAMLQEVAEFALQSSFPLTPALSLQGEGDRFSINRDPSPNDSQPASLRFATKPGLIPVCSPSPFGRGEGAREESAAILHRIGSTWEPDFVLLDDGLRVQAGCVCFPSFWSLPEKLGKPIADVHAPVPGLNDEVGAKMQNFLHRLKPGEVWERWNWGLAATPELNCHPKIRRARLNASATLVNTWFRVEHQALVRLPQTGAILFGIRVLVSSLEEEARAEPGFAPILRQQLASMPEAVADYKGLGTCRAVLLEQL